MREKTLNRKNTTERRYYIEIIEKQWRTAMYRILAIFVRETVVVLGYRLVVRKRRHYSFIWRHLKLYYFAQLA